MKVIMILSWWPLCALLLLSTHPWYCNSSFSLSSEDASSDLHDLVNSLHQLVPTEKYCTKLDTWMKSYSTFHQDNIIKDTSPKLIFVPILSGLADRLIGVSTSFLFAVLTDRVFQIGNRHQLPFLETIFTSPHINWTRGTDEEWLLDPLRDITAIRNYEQSILSQGKYNAVNTINQYKLQDAFLRQDISHLFGTSENVFISINRGKTIRIFENVHYKEKLAAMGLSSYTAFGCLIHYLFTPRPEIFIPVLPQLRALVNYSSPHNSGSTGTQVWPALRIGIHIRTGDRHLMSYDHAAPGLASFHHHFDCATQIETFARASPTQPVVWYLLTDSPQLRKEAVEKYGDKVLTSLTSRIEHSAKEPSVCTHDCTVSHAGFQTAAAEWYLLGLCEYFVISEWSGFGRSAAFRSLRNDSIYTIRNDKRGRPLHAVCDQRSFTELGDMPYDWSGI